MAWIRLERDTKREREVERANTLVVYSRVSLSLLLFASITQRGIECPLESLAHVKGPIRLKLVS
jgi:hypothetical protein